MEGAFDTLTSYPAPVSLTYTTKDGTAITDTVFPGQVVVLVNATTSSDDAMQLLSTNGGHIVSQIPNGGIYLVTIEPTKINAFLATMYQSALVIDAFPNGRYATDGTALGDGLSFVKVSSDPNGLIQTVDASAHLSCGAATHKDVVAAFAGQGGVSVRINDVTISYPFLSAGSSWGKITDEITALLDDAAKRNSPVIINVSMGPRPDNIANDFKKYKCLALALDEISKRYPSTFDNALILLAGSDKNLDQTNSFLALQAALPGSPIWGSLYFIESSEGGGTGGCGLGHAIPGTPHVLAALGCNVTFPNNIKCSGSGTSYSTPEIANLIGTTFEAGNRAIGLHSIASALFEYQKNHNWALPQPSALLRLSGGGGCTYKISASNQTINASGGSGNLTITTDPDCGWTATSDVPWIYFIPANASTGIGTKTISYSVDPNPDATQRVGYIGNVGVDHLSVPIKQLGNGGVSTEYLIYDVSGAVSQHVSDMSTFPSIPSIWVAAGEIAPQSFSLNDDLSSEPYWIGITETQFTGTGTYPLTGSSNFAVLSMPNPATTNGFFATAPWTDLPNAPTTGGGTLHITEYTVKNGAMATIAGDFNFIAVAANANSNPPPAYTYTTVSVTGKFRYRLQ